ncbi:MAG TPA: DNA cytosine methyltransferase, partial [Limnochordales bacterium]
TPTVTAYEQPMLVQPMVRRLTPRECERLQGFPDDWTRWGSDGGEISDSARYRMLGNAVAVPVVEWIARRLIFVDAMLRKGGLLRRSA